MDRVHIVSCRVVKAKSFQGEQDSRVETLPRAILPEVKAFLCRPRTCSPISYGCFSLGTNKSIGCIQIIVIASERNGNFEFCKGGEFLSLMVVSNLTTKPSKFEFYNSEI